MIEVDRHQVEGRGSRPSKVEVEDVNDKSIDKRLKCGRETIDQRPNEGPTGNSTWKLTVTKSRDWWDL
jgi:hypothetical protein